MAPVAPPLATPLAVAAAAAAAVAVAVAVAISFCRSHTYGTVGLLDSASELRKVKQIAVLHVDLVNQCLELAVIPAAEEDGVDDLHHNRHDVNEVGRLCA